VNRSYQIFRTVLEFIYTGVIASPDRLSELVSAGNDFGLDYLCSYCSNIQNGDQDLNPSIGTFLNDLTATHIIDLYFNKNLYSDLTFEVDGKKILSHKSIVGVRCEVLRRMISNPKFMEGKSGMVHIEDCSFIAFKAFLEYLYSAHCPIQESEDPIGILSLAHEYDITRLITLCELYISKTIEVATTNGIEKAEIDIIGLLLTAQLHNAKQLEAFLLHFISNNKGPMSKRPEWDLIEGDNLRYIEEHQWPPLSYLKELERYQKEMGEGGGEQEKCVVM